MITNRPWLGISVINSCIWSDTPHPPEWKQTRNRWEFFQGLRSWLLLIGFVLVCVGASVD